MNTYGWLIFACVTFSLLYIDLFFLNRNTTHQTRHALIWSGIWLGISLIFAAGIYVTQGVKPGTEFLTGYVVEKSLSLDNIFVFIMVFKYFQIPPHLQQRVLSYGIIGAIVMRAFFIWGGIEILERFTWVFYIFGFFLIITALKMLKSHEEDTLHEGMIKFLTRYLPVSNQLHGQRFFVRIDQKWFITPLMVSLIFIELTDVLFALDSVPAIFAITTDPFIIYTSNIFAILGLRSLYFVLQDFIPKFHYLKTGLSIILFFIGVKLVGHHFISIPISWSLGFILMVLLGSVGLSYVKKLK